jgi:uncharacterized membrane protein
VEDSCTKIHVSADFGIIHSMVVHFPIAFLSLAFLVDVLALILRRRHGRFFDRAGFWAVTLALLGFMVAIMTGKAAEAFLPHTSQVRSVVKRHELDALITAALTAMAWIAQALTRFVDAQSESDYAWSVAKTGRGRVTLLSLLLITAAVVMMIFTASHGGALVHRYKV